MLTHQLHVFFYLSYTDLPSIVSGSSLAFLDPHEKYFKQGETGRRFDLAGELLTSYKDQFSPYENVLDCKISQGRYEGTLFRFPLRNKPSKLSTKLYSTERVKELFEVFKEEAGIILLFLKNVEEISLYETNETLKEKRLFAVKVSIDCVEEVRKRRKQFLEEAEELLYSEDSECAVKPMKVTIVESSSSAKHDWFVCNCVSTEDKRLQELSAKLKLPPWIGIARPLNGSNCEALDKSGGRIFCFLPLPPDVHTGLPVHINGSFGLTDNRRGLKWPGPECRDDAAEWNELLLKEVGSLAYKMLLLYLKTVFHNCPNQSKVDEFFKAWPDLSRVQREWLPMLNAMFTDLIHEEVFYTGINGGTWTKPEDSIVERLTYSFSSDVRKCVTTLLQDALLPVVSLPDHLLTIVDNYMSEWVKMVEPSIVREQIKLNPNALNVMERKKKLLLLEYVLSDKCYSELSGVPLLPLANGDFAEFHPINKTRYSNQDLVYVASTKHPQSVLPNMERHLLDENIPFTILDVLRSLAVSPASKRSSIQLVALDAKLVHLLLKQALPRQWISADDQVLWCPGSENHPPESWLEAMWLWMNSQKPKPRLVDFESYPLVKKQSGNTTLLVKLKKGGRTIRESSYGSSLPGDVVSLLKKVGVITISNVPAYLENYPNLEDYLLPPTPNGVLCVLQAIGTTVVLEKIKHLPVLERRTLRSFLVSQTVDSHFKEILTYLPIFESLDGKSLLAVKQNGMQNPVSPRHDILPSGISVKNASGILAGFNNDNQRLLNQLKLVRIMSNTAFLRQEILPHINEYCFEDVLKLGEWILMNYYIFCKEDPSFPSALTSVKFVNAGSKCLLAPCELFDPRETLLKQLFAGEKEKFPEGYFKGENVLILLKKLGMKSSFSLTARDIVHIVENVARFNPDVRLRKTNAVLKVLNSNEQLLGQRVNGNIILATCISERPWLPRLIHPPESYPKEMLWFSSQKQLYCPAEIATLNHANLVGSSLPVLSEFMSSNSSLCKIFNWVSPSIESVLQQLFNARECVPAQQRNLIPFNKMIKEIYDFLLREVAVIQSNKAVRDMLEQEAVVFVENKFVAGKCLSFKWKNDGAPYFYAVPPWAQKYKSLFELFGVREKFHTDDFVHALTQMKENKGQNVLSHDELMVAKTLILELKEASENDLRSHGCIPVLNERNKLQPVSELVINSTPWVKAEQHTAFVHKDIPIELAYKLGAKPLLDKKLEGYCNKFWQPFGQVEQLTDRLKSILKAYPCDTGIFKELIQNADDAKATEIHFIYDTRRLPTKYIFQGKSNWKELQGPALCVYNNRPFDKKDVEGIRSLGVGSKIDDAEKIGRYGIGFNAVYHLTDCPSFLSDDDTLGILDPHARYAPGATHQSPGALYEHIDEELKSDFRDVMKGFEFSKYLQLKGATLFRFPLRNYLMAKNSQISNQASLNEIEYLLSKFESETKEMLLFLNYVNTVTVSHFGKDGMDVKYRVHTELSSESQTKREKLVNHAKLSKSVPTENVNCLHVTYPITLRDSRNSRKEWLIHQRIGTENPIDPSERLHGRENGLLPRAGVAAELFAIPSFFNTSKCQAFCFLPLPVETNLPVHVNGHFILDSARRNLWKDRNAEGERTVWNRFVKTVVLAEAYQSLLVAAQHYISNEQQPNSPKVKWYLNLFPKVNEVESDWKDLVICLYQLIANKGTCLLPHIVPNLPHQTPQQNQLTWLSIWNVYFEDPSWNSRSKDLQKVLLSNGFPLVTEYWLQNNFEAANVSVKLVNSNEVIRFLKNPYLDLSNINRIEAVELLLKYCLQSSTFGAQIEGLPLLVTEDNYLRRFSREIPVFLTTFADLLPSKKDLFVHQNLFRYLFNANVAKEKIMKIFDISDLGLHLSDVLPWHWKNADRVSWIPGQDEIPNLKWLSRLWEFLTAEIGSNVHAQFSSIFKNWPILPTSNGELVSASVSKYVFDLRIFNEWNKNQIHIAESVKELKCSCIEFELFNDSIKEAVASLVHDYVAHPNSPSDVLSVLGQKMDEENIAGKLNEEKMLRLLKFFQEDGDTLEQLTLNKPTLRRLPFYKTVDGRFVNLAEYSLLYILPEEVPRDGLEPWMIKKKCALLAQCYQLQILYSYLGITEKSSTEFYTLFIFPIFNKLEEKNRMKHLLFLRDKLVPFLRDNDKHKIITHLRSLSIICDTNGVLRPVSYFYDPRNSVYNFFVPEEQHLPKIFCNDDWICFLTDVGLNTEVTTSEFETFASFISKSLKPNLVEGGEILVKELMNPQNRGLHEPKFLRRISQIPFVPTECPNDDLLNLLQLQQQCKDSTPMTFIPFSCSVPTKFQLLVWTSCNLLPSWAVPKEGETLLSDSLGISLEPPLNKVLDHLTNLIGGLCSWLHRELPHSQRWLLQDVIMEIYNFLAKSCKCFSKRWLGECTDSCKEIQKRLSTIPFLLVEEGRVFVKACQLVINLYEEIPPYLYKLPQDYGFLEHLLKKIGTSEHPTPSQYAYVLEKINGSCKGAQLDPESLKKAKSAVYGFFLSMWNRYKDSKSKYATKNVNTRELLGAVHESLSNIQILYLLDTNGYLKCSTDLIHMDSPKYYKILDTRSYSVLQTPFEYGISGARDERLLELLPESLAVPPFKSHFVEKIYPDSINDVCIAEQRNEVCSYVNVYRKLLLSPRFTEGFERIVQNESQEIDEPQQLREKLEKFQKQLQLVCLRSLQTHLVSLKDGSEVPNSVKTQSLFLKFGQTSGKLQAYFSHGEKRETLNIFLCRKIQDFVGHTLKQESHLMAILSCNTPDEIESILDSLGVATTSTKQVHFELGSKISVCFHFYLKQDCCFYFRENEIVGFIRRDDDVDDDKGLGVDCYNGDEDAADVAIFGGYSSDDDGDDGDDVSRGHFDCEDEELTDNEFSDGDFEKNKEEKVKQSFIFAKVITRVDDATDKTNPYLKQYKIDVGEEEFLQVGVLDLYKFVHPFHPSNTAEIIQDEKQSKNEKEETDDIIERLRKELKEIFNLPDVERKTATRRLYLHWHPDRNPENTRQATIVTQFIESEIRRLNESNSEVLDFGSWSCVARKQRQSFENFHRHNTTCHSTRKTFDGSSFFDFSRQLHRTGYLDPDAKEARRWIKQTREDLRAAEHCLLADPPLFYMTCFQSHQVIEKALKAALYSYCGLADEQLKTHDLLLLANEVQQIVPRGHIDVYHLAAKARNFYIPTRYPNQQPAPNVPAEMYGNFDATTALEAAKTILLEMQRFIGINV